MNAIERPTLVLNRNWQAINVAPVHRAMSLVFNESARFVEPSSYQLMDWLEWSKLPTKGHLSIRSPRQEFRVPEVISLNKFDRLPSSDVTFSRRNIFKRDKYTCQYCHVQPGSDELTIDHVLPRAQGGESSWKNCVLACLECNGRKADRTPKEARMPLKKEPVRPKWKPLYSEYAGQVPSWSNFISGSYWDTELES